MPNMNKVTLIGHLGRDPETRQVNDTTVCNCSMAVTDKRRDDTQWFSLSVWGKRAAVFEKYLSKGDAVLVEGQVSLRKWESDGKSGAEMQVFVTDFVFLPKGEQREARADKPAVVHDDMDDTIPF